MSAALKSVPEADQVKARALRARFDALVLEVDRVQQLASDCDADPLGDELRDVLELVAIKLRRVLLTPAERKKQLAMILESVEGAGGECQARGFADAVLAFGWIDHLSTNGRAQVDRALAMGVGRKAVVK